MTSLTENLGKVNKGDHEKEDTRYLEDRHKMGMIPNMKVTVVVAVAHDDYRGTVLVVSSAILLFQQEAEREMRDACWRRPFDGRGLKI
jgi:hypothetical protein